MWQWLKKYWGLVVVTIGGFGVIWVYQADELIDQRAKYTVGYITGWHFTKSGKHFDFQFSVANILHVGTSLSDKGMNTANGSRFVVEYDSIDPSTNVDYFAIAIPDSIRQAPANGWRKPP